MNYVYNIFQMKDFTDISNEFTLGGKRHKNDSLNLKWKVNLERLRHLKFYLHLGILKSNSCNASNYNARYLYLFIFIFYFEKNLFFYKVIINRKFYQNFLIDRCERKNISKNLKLCKNLRSENNFWKMLTVQCANIIT